MNGARRRSGLALPTILLLAGLSVAAGLGCTDGVTPVCDDAGSCLIAPPPGSDASAPADASGDAQAETGAFADASADGQGDAPIDGAAD